jgi:hypothetical protein
MRLTRNPQSFQRQWMAGDFTDLPAFGAFDAIAVISHASCTHQATPMQLRRCWLPMAELPTTGIGPTGIAVTLPPLGALLVLVTTVTLAVFKPWGQTRFQRQ